MTQDLKIDTIIHTIAKQLVHSGRTHVRLGLHCSVLMGVLRMMFLLVMMIVGVGSAWGQTNYAIYVSEKGYLKNVANQHETNFDNFATNSKWTYTADGKLQCGTVFLKDNGTTITTTTTETEATVWTKETYGVKSYFKTSDGKYMKSGWLLSEGISEEDDRYVGYEVKGNDRVIWIPAGTYVLVNKIIDYSRTDKNPPNLLYDPQNNNKTLLLKPVPKVAAENTRWEVTLDADGYYYLKNVGTRNNIRHFSIATRSKPTAESVADPSSDNACRFVLKVYGNNGENGFKHTISKYDPWCFNICPYNVQAQGFNVPGDDVANEIALRDPYYQNKLSFGSQWHFIPYETEVVDELQISGETTLASIGDYTFTATGRHYTKVVGSENPNTNFPITVDGVSNSNIAYVWSLRNSPSDVQLSTGTTTDNTSSVTLTVNSMPSTSTNMWLKCTATDANGYSWEKEILVRFMIVEEIESLGEIDNLEGIYKLKKDITSSSGISGEFRGILDGNFHTITGLRTPLFTSLNNAVVKNVLLDNVTVDNQEDNADAGAICEEADGGSLIYNCGVLSGSVGGTLNVGGLVGLIKSNSNVRVVNCFNYADVRGGSYAAGIVGKNEGTVGDVRIALCMMYGNVTNATNISPVYAGNHTSNAKNFTEYNFWLYQRRILNVSTGKEELVKTNLSYTAYNDQLAIDKEEYLTRFPFYRHILNTHRELASYFLFGDYIEEHVNEIGHWAVKKGDDTHKYPIIEKWEKNRKSTPTQTQNDLPNTTADYAGKLLTAMGSNGYLSVSIKIGSSNYSASLPITDMDTLRYDYTYGKVILPFANEYEVNNDYSKICTGWKITKVGNNTSSSVANYNFADRDNLQKDIYDEATNPFIYAQGGYYIVPTGVTSIEITANFATAYYLSDATYEIGYNSDYGGRTGLGGDVPAFQGQPLYTTLTAAVAALTITTDNPHKQAIVLVGNYHYDLATETLNNYTGKGFTLMSIDADNNQEPDYGFYSIGPERPKMPALRFDFLPIISLGMAAKVKDSYYYPGVPVWKSRGWYEQTETTVSIMNQFELDSGNFNLDETADENKGKGQNPCIINGGYFVQMIRSNKTECSKVSYFKIGGNAYIKEFYPGAHSGATSMTTTTIVPVNVTGGQVDECFMTGYRSGGKAIGGDIRFWCSGGKIGKFLGAYMDTPMQTSESAGNVNMTAKVDHALISRFFGGGTSKNATITGDIKVTINNSKIDFYCGGPEFGDMETGKTVVTTANNTKFGEYYGAGFGGTSITYSPKDGELAIGPRVPFSGYTYNTSRLNSNGSLGLATCYKFEFLMHSFNKSKLVARFITGYADFSLATTGSVTNILTGCTVENDFYGAGCQGKVNGTVTSTLKNCTIMRNAFGGGYKAVSNEVKVYPAAAPTPLSIYNGETGIFSEFGTTDPETYTWEQGNGTTPVAQNNKKLKTSGSVTLTDLGNVTGAISLTVDGGYVGGSSEGQTPPRPATATTEAIPAGGSVYGGGNESKSLNNATVTLKGDAFIFGNVFGGGNKAEVQGSATVNIIEE